VANARLAYRSFETAFSGPTWEALEELGAHPQRPLWASTGTKDQLYSDVLYVSELIGPDVINTMPEATLLAFADHGIVARTVDAEEGQPVEVLGAAARTGVDMKQITAELERDGVRAFCASYDELLRCIDKKLQGLTVDAAADAHLFR
jgi:transaldolase